MIKNFSKTTNVTANCVIDDVVVVSMRATVEEDGNIVINKNVRNSELYVANLEQCNLDYAEFETEVIKALQA